MGGEPEGAEEDEEPVSEKRKIWKLFNHFARLCYQPVKTQNRRYLIILTEYIQRTSN